MTRLLAFVALLAVVAAATAALASAGTKTSKAQFGDFSFVKKTDTASAPLFSN
jgi:hypothetical protein